MRELKILLLSQFKELDISQQIDYDKSYLYSLITHTAIEESTVTKIENQLLFGRQIRNIKQRRCN